MCVCVCSISNPQASGSVLEAVTSTLKKYPFDFRGARILSGEDEGLFGWVTANYLLENFVKVEPTGLSPVLCLAFNRGALQNGKSLVYCV